MASNSFGTIFRITTFGESHGEAMGVVIDGCPAGLFVSEEDINKRLCFRAPGRNDCVSPRSEEDEARIISGIFDGKTTGAPIAILIENKYADSSKYEAIKNLLRPGHANFTYLKKYGVFDYRGGGRASARETVCRVAAGVVASKILEHYGIKVAAFLKSMGDVGANIEFSDLEKLRERICSSPVFCPDNDASDAMMELVRKVKIEGDSIGGCVEFVISNVAVGLGDPVYDKLGSKLGSAMLSIPAAKGFEIGDGFAAAKMKGSEHNDLFTLSAKTVVSETNHSGGILGGISTGMPVVGRVAFKPTASIFKQQRTVDLDGREMILQLPAGSRHDPCVAIRAVPVVEAMCAIVVADAVLLNHNARL